MNNKKRIAKLKEEDYQKLFGVKKQTFDKMLSILSEKYKQEHLRGGHPPKLSVLDKLVIMLGYYREYRTMENIAFDYSVSKSTICESIKWVENTLIKSGIFSLPSKRELINNKEIDVILIDATECEIERPKKNNKNITPERKRSIR